LSEGTLAEVRLLGFLIGGGGIPPSAICAADGRSFKEVREVGFLMGGGGMPPSAICALDGMEDGREITEALEVGFLMGGGGIPPSARRVGPGLAGPVELSCMKQRDSPHRVRAEIIVTFLGVIFFSIGEVESREQRNSVRQASRKRRDGAASTETCSVLRAGEKRYELRDHRAREK